MIAEDYKGYVQYAIAMGILNVQFTVEQGPFDVEPVIKAYFNPSHTVTRADFAAAAVRYHTN